jgi:hypothetical protein
VWTLADSRSVDIVEHPAGAGNSVATLFVDDLDAAEAASSAGSSRPSARRTPTAGATTYRDPDGNEVAFAGAPAD